MVNTKQKGYRTVQKAITHYQEQGWLVDKVEKTGKFIVEKDLFSSECDGFDLIGIKKNCVLLIQVKTNYPPTQKSYKTFANKYAGDNLLVQAYTWYDSKGAVIHSFLPKNKVYKEDLRK